MALFEKGELLLHILVLYPNSSVPKQDEYPKYAANTGSLKITGLKRCSLQLCANLYVVSHFWDIDKFRYELHVRIIYIWPLRTKIKFVRQLYFYIPHTQRVLQNYSSSFEDDVRLWTLISLMLLTLCKETVKHIPVSFLRYFLCELQSVILNL